MSSLGAPWRPSNPWGGGAATSTGVTTHRRRTPAVDDDLPFRRAGNHVQRVRPRLHPPPRDLRREREVDARGFVGAESPRLAERDQFAHDLTAARRRAAVAQLDGPAPELDRARVQWARPLR